MICVFALNPQGQIQLWDSSAVQPVIQNQQLTQQPEPQPDIENAFTDADLLQIYCVHINSNQGNVDQNIAKGFLGLLDFKTGYDTYKLEAIRTLFKSNNSQIDMQYKTRLADWVANNLNNTNADYTYIVPAAQLSLYFNNDSDSIDKLIAYLIDVFENFKTDVNIRALLTTIANNISAVVDQKTYARSAELLLKHEEKFDVPSFYTRVILFAKLDNEDISKSAISYLEKHYEKMNELLKNAAFGILHERSEDAKFRTTHILSNNEMKKDSSLGG